MTHRAPETLGHQPSEVSPWIKAQIREPRHAPNREDNFIACASDDESCPSPAAFGRCNPSALPNPRSEQPPVKTEEWSWSRGPTAMAGVGAGAGVATGGRKAAGMARRVQHNDLDLPNLHTLECSVNPRRLKFNQTIF